VRISKEHFKAAVPAVIVMALFAVSAYFSQRYGERLNVFVEGGGFFGMIVYVFIAIAATVVAPVSAAPLIPVAASAWGVLATGALSILGWTIGSLLAFIIGRRYGMPLVQKFVAPEKLNRLQKYIPREKAFWSVVVLRIMVPVDILSYALGIFGVLDWRRYTLATVVGISPFAFLLAYLGTLPLIYQIISIPIGLLVIFIIYISGGKKFYR